MNLSSPSIDVKLKERKKEDRHTSSQKAFQSVEERICWVRYHPAIALHKVDQVFKYYITSL
jgi:hypothetical protein